VRPARSRAEESATSTSVSGPRPRLYSYRQDGQGVCVGLDGMSLCQGGAPPRGAASRGRVIRCIRCIRSRERSRPAHLSNRRERGRAALDGDGTGRLSTQAIMSPRAVRIHPERSSVAGDRPEGRQQGQPFGVTAPRTRSSTGRRRGHPAVGPLVPAPGTDGLQDAVVVHGHPALSCCRPARQRLRPQTTRFWIDRTILRLRLVSRSSARSSAHGSPPRAHVILQRWTRRCPRGPDVGGAP
jgi:hypothetical protein